ncbi:fungal-specific transcription factor domain-containing protein [Phyllosticta capitalensis]
MSSASAVRSSSKPAANMAGPATKSTSSSSAQAGAKKSSNRSHKRSRTGCFTCRLRRKKCDEVKPGCKACKNLGLQCQYKRPMWWSNQEERLAQKEKIKNIIKRTKLTEKTYHAVPINTQSPPSLCNSVPTSDGFSDSMSKTRAASVDSQLSDFNNMSPPQMYNMGMALPPYEPSCPPYPGFAPYEIDIKTECQTFINDVPTRRDSTISSFSAFQPPSVGSSLAPENWVQQDYFEQQQDFFDEPLDMNFLEFTHGPVMPSYQAVIQVDEADQPLLNHFIDKVVPRIFPILEVTQYGSARAELIFPNLESNKPFLHCCLSIAAQHMKATQVAKDADEEQNINQSIIHHRLLTITELCESLARDADYAQTLEAQLAVILFQCSVGIPDDGLQDIPWYDHFEGATKLIERLDLANSLVAMNGNPTAQVPFNVSLVAWIDILGATMLGRSPMLADAYRQKMLAGASTGLAELMGCEDQIMYLISEIACLESIKTGMDDSTLCSHITLVGKQITLTEQAAGPVGNCYSSSGAIKPAQLRNNITAVFRIATRILLCSMVPGFNRRQPTAMKLVDELTTVMSFIPTGADGLDKSLVWPLLIAGSHSLEGSGFRTMFAERAELMGEEAKFGSFGQIKELLKDVWAINDANLATGDEENVHWRDVMRQKGWDFLLI